MIPMDYFVALITSALLVLYRLVDVTNRYVNIIIDTTLSLVTGASWAYLAISENNLHLWGDAPTFASSLLLMLIIGLPIGFVLMVLAWHDPLYIPPMDEESERYTENTLLGMEGIVVQKYGEKAYLCKLTDKAQTSILAYIDNAKEGDKFIIEKFENGKIVGRVVTP